MRISRWPLRRRLVLAIVGLLAAVSVAIGAVSVLTLRDFLVTRLDSQLVGAIDRSQNAITGGGRGEPPAPSGYLAIPGQSEGTLGAIIGEGVISASVLNREGEPVLLTLDQARALAAVPPDTQPRTLDLGSTLGDYRVVVQSIGDVRLLVGLPLSEVNATVVQLALVIGLVSLAGLAAVAAAGTVMVRLSLRPLERVVSTATRVSELPLDRGDVSLAERVSIEDADPGTEVGRVGAAINRMLGHIASALAARQASESKVRAFVADASHELRTPLSSIRGYAELTRRSGHELPPDIVHAMSRIESESIRMTELVEELLLLARLDEGRALESVEVELAGLIDDAVNDSRAADDDHNWVTDVADEPVIVTGDPARLRQVLGNLLTNARVHTPEGTTVTTTLTLDAASSRAVIEVHDDGPGVEPAVLDSVFERFVRGDASRSRVAGSTGLGLAIVRAVVEAHHGETEVESVPGSTVFRVLLPLA